jgi:opacity protein-like surface antigen
MFITKRMLMALGSACVVLSQPHAAAAERVNLGDFLMSKSPAIAPSMSLNYTLATKVDFDKMVGGFSIEQATFSLPLTAPIYLNDQHAFVFGIDYNAAWLESDSPLGNMDLHDFRFMVRWMNRQPGSKWSWTARLSPGVATDGSSMTSDDFVVSGQAGFRYRSSDRFAWLGGVAFSVDGMESRVIPGIGFQWMPIDEVIVRLTGPSLKASWRPHDDWLLHAGVWSAGSTWNVENNGNSFDIRLKSFQAGIGVERRLSEKVWLGLWAGATISNELEIDTDSGNEVFKDDADSGWFARIGIRKVLW